MIIETVKATDRREEVRQLATYKEQKDSLHAQMAEALSANDSKGITQIARAISALEKEHEKANREAVSAEYSTLADEILSALRDAFKPFWKKMEKVGMTKKITVQLEGKTVSVPAQKRSGGGGGGGGAGKTKTTYGRSLGEIFEAYATPEERAALEAAKGDGNKTWSIKDKVKKRLIADGTLVPQS